jgi:hypothetical protein
MQPDALCSLTPGSLNGDAEQMTAQSLPDELPQ